MRDRFRILTIPGLVLRAGLDVMFPPSCLSCQAPLGCRASSFCCRSCLEAMVPVDEWDETYLKVRAALIAEGSVSGFVALWYFEREGPVQALMHRLKYGGVTSVGLAFGGALGERILESGFGTSDFVAPLPLHTSKERERGYNQCAYIARGVSRVTGRPVRTSLLRRVRWTSSQTRLTPGERRENVRNAFALRRGAWREIEGRTILLVDDVVTTGATMASCAAALRRAGARAVIACAPALAR